MVLCGLSLFILIRLDMEQGCIANMEDLGITESYNVKRQMVISASEAAEMIIRVDDIMRAAPRKRQQPRR